MKIKLQTMLKHNWRILLLLCILITASYEAWAGNWTSGYKIYYDNTATGWSKVYLRVGKSDYTSAYLMSKVDGTENLYYYTIPSWSGYENFGVGNNSGWTGGNDLYYLCHDDSYKITGHTEYINNSVSSAFTITSKTEDSYTGSQAKDNCATYYKRDTQASKKTYSVTISAPSNGTITFTYIQEDGSSSGSITSGSTNVLPTCIITVTATPNSGYGLSSLTVDSEPFTPGDEYIVRKDVTIAASFCAAPSFSDGTGTVTVSPNGASACPGTKTLSVATATGGETPYRFQWFRNTTSSTTGGVAVSQKYTENQNGRIYKPSTTDAGTFYYYCVVSGGSCEAERKSAISGSVTIDATHALVVSPAASRVKAYEPVTITATNANVDTWSLSPAESTTQYLYESNKRRTRFKGVGGSPTITYTITGVAKDATITCPGVATVVVESDATCVAP